MKLIRTLDEQIRTLPEIIKSYYPFVNKAYEEYTPQKKWYYFARGESVYFIQGVNGGPVKIGSSAEPYARIRSIQTGYPYQLTFAFVFTFPIHSRIDFIEAERMFHLYFDEYRLNGEWFKEEILDIIKSALNENDI